MPGKQNTKSNLLKDRPTNRKRLNRSNLKHLLKKEFIYLILLKRLSLLDTNKHIHIIYTKYKYIYIYNLFVGDYGFVGLSFIISLLIRNILSVIFTWRQLTNLHQAEDNLIYFSLWINSSANLGKAKSFKLFNFPWTVDYYVLSSQHQILLGWQP